MKKDMINFENYSKEEILSLISLGIEIKNNPKKYQNKLKGVVVALWFEKPSLRTRVSFEAAITKLGGKAVYLDFSTTHKKANIKDEIKCLSKYVDVIVARVFKHSTLKEMQNSSDVPVINALCEKFHPCQALADMMTLFEVYEDPKDLVVSYVGDGNNVCNSLIELSKKVGITLNVSTPKEYIPSISPVVWLEDPKKATLNADVVYTDTWVSMGEEEKGKEKIIKLKDYQVNKELIGNKYFMHCLPAIRGQEVVDEVLDSEKSLVFKQAENRLHIQKAILLSLKT